MNLTGMAVALDNLVAGVHENADGTVQLRFMQLDKNGAVHFTAPGETMQEHGGTLECVVTSVPLPPPTIGATSTANSGGHLPQSTTYYYKVTAYTPLGETTVSAEVSQATAAGTGANTITINWDAVAGAIGYRIYRGTVSDTNLLLDDLPANNWSPAFGTYLATTSYVDKNSAAPAGAPPSVNTAFPVALVTFPEAITEADISIVWGSGVPTTDIAGYVYFAGDDDIWAIAAPPAASNPGRRKLAFVNQTQKVLFDGDGISTLHFAFGGGGETTFKISATGA